MNVDNGINDVEQSSGNWVIEILSFVNVMVDGKPVGSTSHSKQNASVYPLGIVSDASIANGVVVLI